LTKNAAFVKNFIKSKRERMSKTISGFKVIKWFNKDTLAVQYGVDGLVSGKWYHLTGDGGPYIFDTEKEARAKLKELSKKEGVL
jgi:hypothetical protein